jgi:5-methylcytosine-specific restriction endonuclease McrA
MTKRRFTADDKRFAGARAGWKCQICACVLPAAFEVDHVVALEDGGLDCIQKNAQALCPNCHGQKTQQERRVRVKRAMERLRELRESEGPARQSDKGVEEVILDVENPFAKFVFVRNE